MTDVQKICDIIDRFDKDDRYSIPDKTKCIMEILNFISEKKIEELIKDLELINKQCQVMQKPPNYPL